MRCSKCGIETFNELEFCDGCAAPVVQGAVARQTTGESSAGQRRNLAIMFCDIVGSTSLSLELDPEDYKDLVKEYQPVCARAVNSFGGRIAQYLGDGVLAYFGESGQENAPRMAAYAGLEIITGMDELNDKLEKQNKRTLSVRIAIHTGLVVTGGVTSGDSNEGLAVGGPPNITAKIQELAEPNTLVMSEAAYKLTEGFFVCNALGAHQISHISKPMRLYRVMATSEAQNRLDTKDPQSFTPLVGREEEIALLSASWEKIKSGQGKVILIDGEPGIGKSRILDAFEKELAGKSETIMEFQCQPFHRNTALYPVTDQLRRRLKINGEDSSEENLRKLEEYISGQDIDSTEAVPLLANLLSVPLDDRYKILEISPELKRTRTLNMLVKLLLKSAQQNPVFLIVEDLHWVDPSTEELLGRVIEQCQGTPILAVFTFRSHEYVPPRSWLEAPHLIRQNIARLTPAQTRYITEELSRDNGLPVEVVEQIVERTDGVPLFVEELTKAIIESGPLSSSDVPDTLKDFLATRLDRVEKRAQEVAQLGATIGRQFSYALIKATTLLEESVLRGELEHLVQDGLIYQLGVVPESTYVFRHALVREAAYELLLHSTRRQHHRKIAEVLEIENPEAAETQPELLAHHYSEGRFGEKAIRYLLKARKAAYMSAAHTEAINHLNKGLEMLDCLQVPDERDGYELDLQIARGESMIASEGYAATEVEDIFARARQLCGRVRDATQLRAVLRGQWAVYLVRAGYQMAWELSEQTYGLAEEHGDPRHHLEAQLELGFTSLFQGDFTRSKEHLESGFALSNPSHHGSNSHLAIVCLAYSALDLFSLGYPDLALRKSQDAVSIAKLESIPPLHMAQVTGMNAVIHCFRLEFKSARQATEQMIMYSDERGLPYWRAIGSIMLGWIIGREGNMDDGIIELRRGLENYKKTGAELGSTWFGALLAETYGNNGQTEEGLDTIEDALRFCSRTGERYHEADIRRIKGELLWMRGGISNLEAADSSFKASLDVARRQGAKSWELRTALSFARFRQASGKPQEALSHLAPVYNWFTEGFETADMRSAKRLLQELANG